MGNGGGPGGKRGQKNLLGLHSEAHRFISPVAPGLSLEVRSSIIKTPPTGGAPEARRSRPHERHRVGVSGGVQEDHLVPACTTAESLSPHPWAAGAAYRDGLASAVPTGSGSVDMLNVTTRPGAVRERPGGEEARAGDGGVRCTQTSDRPPARVAHRPGGQAAESIYLTPGGTELRSELAMPTRTLREPPAAGRRVQSPAVGPPDEGAVAVAFGSKSVQISVPGGGGTLCWRQLPVHFGSIQVAESGAGRGGRVQNARLARWVAEQVDGCHEVV